MQNDKLQKLIDKQNELIEKTKPIALKSIIGQWAVECLRSGTPMNTATLRAWTESTTLKSSDKLIINELLNEILE